MTPCRCFVLRWTSLASVCSTWRILGKSLLYMVNLWRSSLWSGVSMASIYPTRRVPSDSFTMLQFLEDSTWCVFGEHLSYPVCPLRASVPCGEVLAITCRVLVELFVVSSFSKQKARFSDMLSSSCWIVTTVWGSVINSDNEFYYVSKWKSCLICTD